MPGKGHERVCSVRAVAMTGILIASVLLLSPGLRDTSRQDIMPYATLDDVIITEFRDAPQGAEQVEIFNQAGLYLSMSGWALVIDGARYDLSPLSTLYARAHKTIGDSNSNLVVDIELNDEGSILQIVDNAGTIRNEIRYGQLGPVPDPINGESVSRVRSGTVYGNQWTRSEYPTFGYSNSVPPSVTMPSLVLNEVLFNTADPNDRFIELYYRGLGTFDYTGSVIVVDSAYYLPMGSLSKTKPYLLIKQPEAPSLFSGMDADGDNVYLLGANGAFMDMVGWTTPHFQDFSVSRVPDGFGKADGFDDASSITAGWLFDVSPTLPLVSIGPSQDKKGDLGERVFYLLTTTNLEPIDEYVNVRAIVGMQGWSMLLWQADGITPLADSPGDPDGIPDVGLVPSGGSASLQVSIDIPPSPPADDWEVSSVKASIALDPLAQGSTVLTTEIYPYEWPTASATPSTIWIESSPPPFTPKETMITLNVTGHGTATYSTRPLDTVLIIDSSGSMSQNDPTNLRLDAAKHYVDLLTVPDRAAVVEFDQDAYLVNGDHLSSNYAQIKSNIDTIDSMGSTNLYDPIRISNNELLTYGNKSRPLVEIMLTDGDEQEGHSDAQILSEAVRAANNGIIIFTIGLIGLGGVNEQLLMDIANTTGGVYLQAQSASDLDSIYQRIGRIVKNPEIAGYDDDVMDNIPMFSAFLPGYLNYVAGSASPAPNFVGQIGGMTNLQWNLSRMMMNESWEATLKVTSSLDGFALPALSYPESRVAYLNSTSNRVYKPFPEVFIDVLARNAGKICGTKWYDSNRDGVKDPSEPPIGGFKIELYQNGTLIDSTFTTVNGTYCFEDLENGDYTVREVMPPTPGPWLTWSQTYPGGNGSWDISMVNDTEVTDADFGNAADFEGCLTWGYWKTHTGFDSPPRDATYDALPQAPMSVDVRTPDGNLAVDSDSEARWLFKGAGTGRSPNCSGDCRSLFRAQLMAAYMNTLKYVGMEAAVYLYAGDTHNNETVQQILSEAIVMLTDGQQHDFTAFQGTLDRINNNGEGRKVLFMLLPPTFHY